MLDRLEAIHQRYEELSRLLCDPEVINDTKKLREYSKEQAGLEEKNQAYIEYKETIEQLNDAKSMLEDKPVY